MVKHLIRKCSDIIKHAKNIVVLTGAGMSTESGIKDFRSRTGIYQMAPEYILSLNYFYKHPREFFQFAIENLYHPNAAPNKGHEILAKWENEGKLLQIITQNVDGLHQLAGSQNVIEFHGTMKTATCRNCGEKFSTEELAARIIVFEEFFVCDHCETTNKNDRYIKPDVVLFGDRGEWFTEEGFQEITNRIQAADCVIVLGTSLQVTPFSIFPSFRGKSTPMIIINKGDTPYDHEPNSYVIQESIGKTLSLMDPFQ
jgi:NAD-dependent deacetylase